MTTINGSRNGLLNSVRKASLTALESLPYRPAVPPCAASGNRPPPHTPSAMTIAQPARKRRGCLPMNWPSRWKAEFMKLISCLGLIAGRVEQAAHFAHSLQDARRHSADQRRVHGEHVMSAHRAKVAETAPLRNLSHALRAGGGDEYYV